MFFEKFGDCHHPLPKGRKPGSAHEQTSRIFWNEIR
jgi:hypothetical protein